MALDTVFTNDSGSSSGAIDYVKDVFDDVSLEATNNTGLTDSATTNPLGDLFANNDAPKFASKTLFIKDIVLIEDRSKWVSNKPTYRIIWNENFPGVNGYVFGDILINYETGQPYITFRTIADGMGITGKIRKVAWLVNGTATATATATMTLDGVATANSPADFSNLATNSDTTFFSRFNAYVHAGTNETNDLHDYRITALQTSTLQAVGAIVYYENSGANLEFFPGTTYVDKGKNTTISGASLALPAYGSSLGGVSVFYKTSTNTYALSSLSATTMVSIAQGSSGTNLVSVSTGHGASFPAGAGIVVAQGTSMYVGTVQSVSTDTLTVFPTLGFGITNAIYRSWLGGSTLGINASLMQLAYSIDFSKIQSISLPILDPQGRFAFWGGNIGCTLISNTFAAVFLGASGFMQTDGYFQAAEVEMIGSAIFNATLSVNGLPNWSINTGQTGAIKRTVFTDSGLGWQNFLLQPGTSMGTIGIAKINLYTRANLGVTFGALASMDTLQAFTERTAINATLMSLGTLRRVYADQLFLQGSWVRSVNTASPGGAEYAGSSTNSKISFQYYGKNFSMLGTAGGGTLTIDGVGTPLNFGQVTTVASEGFHKVTYVVGSGATAIIRGIDFSASKAEIKSAQKYQPVIVKSKEVKLVSIINNRDNSSFFTSQNHGVYQVLDEVASSLPIGRGRWRISMSAPISATPNAGSCTISVAVTLGNTAGQNILLQRRVMVTDGGTVNGSSQFAFSEPLTIPYAGSLYIQIVSGGNSGSASATPTLGGTGFGAAVYFSAEKLPEDDSLPVI
jgi:hypothetical protein